MRGAAQSLDLFLEPKLLPLEFPQPDVVGRRVCLFLGYHSVEVLVTGVEFADAGGYRHRGGSFSC
jgi:hypothetical protein